MKYKIASRREAIPESLLLEYVRVSQTMNAICPSALEETLEKRKVQRQHQNHGTFQIATREQGILVMFRACSLCLIRVDERKFLFVVEHLVGFWIVESSFLLVRGAAQTQKMVVHRCSNSAHNRNRHGPRTDTYKKFIKDKVNHSLKKYVTNDTTHHTQTNRRHHSAQLEDLCQDLTVTRTTLVVESQPHLALYKDKCSPLIVELSRPWNTFQTFPAKSLTNRTQRMTIPWSFVITMRPKCYWESPWQNG